MEIVSGLPVIRLEWMPSAKITSYKPTCWYQSIPDERLGDFSTAETLTRVGQCPISNWFIHFLERLSDRHNLRARRE